jgi:adenosylcobinamide-GDP ribazoletransferase
VLKAKEAFKFIILESGTGAPGRSAIGVLSFPLAGLGMGFVLMVINRLISPYLPTEILAVVLLVMLISATAGHHLAGAHETFGNLPKRNPGVNSVERRQVYGLLAVLLIILFKIHSLEVIGESRAFSLLLTPLLARWSLLLFLFGSGSVVDNGSPPIGNGIRAWHLVAATVMSLGLALFTAGAQALWVALTLSLFALLARGYLIRRAEGISLANCGALIEVAEALGFTLFASL